ncbi:MAG: hypothetical protein DME82_07090 [Verrucomicrobia bacterium]|nr:MAG: hypothetical protein DME82_07090 [Verrucomicrobiota bacterium]
MAGALTEMFVFAPFEAGSRISWWLGYVVIALLYGAPLVAAVCLFVLWPLYVRVPVTSILWSPVVCISAGVVAGCALYFHLVVADLPVSVSRVAFFSALADRHGRRWSGVHRRLLLQAQ